jgi:steroid delta-isomerase-like uncharacterized protein
MTPSPLQVAQRYFDAWNQHDANAIVDTFIDNGTYSDPTTGGPLSGVAIGAYAAGLWAAFPDLAFEIVSVAQGDAGLVSAEWLMKGTNTASFAGLPPTGRAVALPGADFIRVEGDKICSVQGYFDAGTLPRELGLDIIVQPKTIGPFSFGTSNRASSGKTSIPGAFSITWLETRSPEEQQKVAESSQKIVSEMLGMPGFIGWVGATIGDRMMTITAWETPEAPAQMLKGGEHRSVVGRFYSPELGSSGGTSVWVPARLNPRRLRCNACSKMADAEKAQGKCECGAVLPDLPAYW